MTTELLETLFAISKQDRDRAVWIETVSGTFAEIAKLRHRWTVRLASIGIYSPWAEKVI